MLLSATATISIGYTQLVQAEIKTDIGNLKDSISEIKDANLIEREKTNSVQITQAEIKGDIKLILDKITDLK